MVDSLSQDRTEDDILVAQFKATGDNEFFARLFDRYRRSIFAACFKIVHDSHAAEDLTQETFVIAFRQIDSYYGGGFVGWLRTIARNLCFNLLRQRQRMVLEAAVPEKTSGQRNRNLHCIAENVMDILGRLPDEQRIALKLLLIQGYSYKEISEAMQVSTKQVKSYVQNGKRRFGVYWAAEKQTRESVEERECRQESRGAGSTGSNG